MRALALLSLLTLTGCSVKYGCKGMPDDPVCRSAVEAYRATETAKPVTATEHAPSQTPAPAATASGSTAATPAESTPQPRLDDPTPLRTPPQVLRIWVAPWEDADGDLNVSGYVFTELAPRRWLIGQPQPAARPLLMPLQVHPRETPSTRRPSPAERHPQLPAVQGGLPEGEAD